MPSAPSYCPACARVFPDFVPGGSAVVRPRALCPNCGCLERHRVLALVLDGLAPMLAAARVVLDIAPTASLTRILARETGGLYLPCDIDPAADSRRVMLQADLTHLPLPDDSVDVIMCTQVLEHVPDDLAAMREIKRVLSPGGIAFVNVPYRPGTLTDEDPSAPPEERIRRFGQADHVRFYGDDFDDRLRAAGLGFTRTTGPELVGAELADRIGLVDPQGKVGPEWFWFVWKDPSRTAPGLPGFHAAASFAMLSSGVSRSLLGALRPWARVRWPGKATDLAARVVRRLRRR